MAFDPKQAQAAVNENMASSMQGFAAASKTMQAVTSEMMAMSMDSMKKTAKVFEEMQAARSWPDIMRIQTEFFRSSFEDFAARSRRIAELASAAPVDLAKRTTEAAEKIGEQTEQAVKTVTDNARVATIGLDTSVPPAG